MTTEPGPIDFYYCPDKKKHQWEYRGRREQKYRCWECALIVTKSQLKEATDA